MGSEEPAPGLLREREREREKREGERGRERNRERGREGRWGERLRRVCARACASSLIAHQPAADGPLASFQNGDELMERVQVSRFERSRSPSGVSV